MEAPNVVERAICDYEIDTLFHLAGQTIVGSALRAPLQTFEANIRGTYHLLEGCRRQAHYIKCIVIASSDKVYGPSNLPYTETMPLMGNYPYDVSKSCCDLIAQSYFQTYNLPITIARCCNIYGGGDHNRSRLIPGTIRNLLHDEQPLIRSDGSFIREYLYVKDVIDAYFLLAEKTQTERVKGEAFNFGSSRPYSVLEVVNLLRKIMKKEHLETKILNSVQTEIRYQHLNSNKAKEMLGWEPSYSLEKGLKETIELSLTPDYAIR